MNWDEVYEWLKSCGYVNSSWERIDVMSHGLYCGDDAENTIISIFVRKDGELVCYLGMYNPDVEVGGRTGLYLDNTGDLIDYLEWSLEDLSNELMRKVVG